MLKNVSQPPLEFIVSPHFEVCYALASLSQPNIGLHPKWMELTKARLGEDLSNRLTSYGFAFWLGVADVLESTRPGQNLESLLHGIASVDVETFRMRLLCGLLHDEDIVIQMVEGKLTPAEAINRLPEVDREWYAKIEVYPFMPESPIGTLIETLVHSPAAVKEFALKSIEEFWDRAFSVFWERLVPEYNTSKNRAERLAMSANLSELAGGLRLLVDVDQEAGEIVAFRGDCRTPFQDLDRCYFMPSAFNIHRFWTIRDYQGKSPVAFFPFFDHTLQVDRVVGMVTNGAVHAGVDPASVCKALGDATRLAAISLLAQQPRNSAQLARELGVSRPTISHHVFLMREAGLIEERAVGKAVELSVNRTTIEGLSSLLTERIFGAAAL